MKAAKAFLVRGPMIQTEDGPDRIPMRLVVASLACKHFRSFYTELPAPLVGEDFSFEEYLEQYACGAWELFKTTPCPECGAKQDVPKSAEINFEHMAGDEKAMPKGWKIV